MDPIVHLKIHNQAHASFERSIRRGRVATAARRRRPTADGPGRERAWVTLGRLLHLRHA